MIRLKLRTVSQPAFWRGAGSLLDLGALQARRRLAQRATGRAADAAARFRDQKALQQDTLRVRRGIQSVPFDTIRQATTHHETGERHPLVSKH